MRDPRLEKLAKSLLHYSVEAKEGHHVLIKGHVSTKPLLLELVKECKNIGAHPHVELCVSGENMSWLRLGGQVVFSDRLEVKEKIFNLSSIVRDVYKSKDNPEFVIFYLKEISASISSFVEPVKIFNQ